MFSTVFNNNDRSCDDLVHAIKNVFCPPNEPEDEAWYDYGRVKGMQLFARTVCAAVDAYYDYIDDVHKPQWNHILQMLRSLCHSDQNEEDDQLEEYLSQLRGMQPGDSCILPFLKYRTAIIFRKQDHRTLYEEIPNEVFDDGQFQSELGNFLRCINSKGSDTPQARYNDIATFRPQYTIQFLSGILRAVGRPAEVNHCAKRVHQAWYRSKEWFFIQVAVKSSLGRSPLRRTAYKTFMLFFVLNLANYAANTSCSSNLLHLMKLGASVPKWLSDAVMQTCTRFSQILDKCIQAQIVQRMSPPWNPSQLDLTRDIQLSLSHSSKYLFSSLTNHGPNPPNSHVLHLPI
ncbi:hypothetical protein OG21DRAFT_1489458 [Imleria badia]|nr:hypothetical protein OG21DRAFT_1489458 [Imleria badia]